MQHAPRRITYQLVLTSMCVATLGGCAALPRGDAVPFEIQDRAAVAGFGPGIRTWGYSLNPAFMENLVGYPQREGVRLAAAGHTGTQRPTAYFLAISGGGQNGAFTAGLLNGWTAAGTRPEFSLVTGISTGALIAPFAFLGPRYDSVLTRVYTQTNTKDILRSRGLGGLFSDALADNAPLWKLVQSEVNADLLQAIAAEHARGRILLVCTTNLDARRAVIWDITGIAASGHPKALELVQKILIASAAIPAAFPPVMIDVEVDGVAYQEMHVDGGAVAQVFVYPPSLDLRAFAEAQGFDRERVLYVVRNGRVDPDWAQTERRTLPIAGRAISSLLHTQGLGDLFRIYLSAQRDKLDFNLGYIPSSFTAQPTEAFDPVYMGQLYQLGYDLAKGGYPWEKTPPGFVVTTRTTP